MSKNQGKQKSKGELGVSKKYIRNNKAISGRLDDELVMMDIDKGKYFALNPVATRVWELLEKPMELMEICRVLSDEYEVSVEQCQLETNEYLEELIRLGLLLVDIDDLRSE